MFIALQRKKQEQIENEKEILFLRESLAKKSSEQAPEEKKRESAVTARTEV